MATTSPDNIWTPDSGDDYALTTDLAAMADTVQDAISDVRTQGVNAAPVTFTPTFTNFSTGSSSLNAKYQLIRGRCVGEIDIVLASGFALNNSAFSVNFPVTSSAQANSPVGLATFLDNGTGWRGGPIISISNRMQPFIFGSGYMNSVDASGNPFGWQTSDRIHLTFDFPTY